MFILFAVNTQCELLFSSPENRASVWPTTVIILQSIRRLMVGSRISELHCSFILRTAANECLWFESHQLVMNSAASLVFSSSKYDAISPLLHQLHWLEAPIRIQHELAVLTFRCLHEIAPQYLADEFLLSRTLRLDVVFAQRHHHHWLSVVYGCWLSATELFRSLLLVCVWNVLLCHVTSAPSLRVSAVVWRLIFSAVRFLDFCSACGVIYVIIDTLIAFVTSLQKFDSLR